MTIPPLLPPSASRKTEQPSAEESLTPPDTLPSTLRIGLPIDPSLSLSALTSVNFPAVQKPSENEVTQFLAAPKTGPTRVAALLANAAPLIKGLEKNKVTNSGERDGRDFDDHDDVHSAL